MKELESFGAEPARLLRAAQYVRMSTEHQQYSTLNQQDRIAEYARSRGIEIVRTYADDGRSGLTFGGRKSLQQLIADVQSGHADFSAILVYDISRWGRFQDADESAYYEYICRRAGIQVTYCAEQFENDGSPIATIVKGVKRAMAGEFSRELSVKVFAGQCRLVEMGFRLGGQAGYGLRRMLVDQSGALKGELRPGEQKCVATDRTILCLGTPEEVEVVRLIFKWFVEERINAAEIAQRLNDAGVPFIEGRRWKSENVRYLVRNPKYTGANVFNRRSFKLQTRRVRNPPEMWIRKEGSFEAVVSSQMFDDAQTLIEQRLKGLSDQFICGALRQLLERHGRLTARIINASDSLPGAGALIRRFGCMASLYALVGYSSSIPDATISKARGVDKLRAVMRSRILSLFRTLGESVLHERSGLITLSGEVTFRIAMLGCKCSAFDIVRWELRTRAGADFVIAARLNKSHDAPMDYFLLPSVQGFLTTRSIAEPIPAHVQACRFESLDELCRVAGRSRWSVPA